MDDPRVLEDRAGVGVITRAAAILRVLGDEPTGMSLGQISRRVGLARSTVQRLVVGLEAEGLVMSTSRAGGIALGPEFMRLARLARPAFVDRAHDIMVRLSDELEETVDLAVVQRNKLVFLDQVIGSQRLLAVSHIGGSFPLHCSSVGKAYLATLSSQEIQRLIGTEYEAATPQTITDLDSLLDSLEEARSSGFAIDDEEHTEGICAIGFVTSEDGMAYGLSVPMPVSRFREKKDLARKGLMAARSALERPHDLFARATPS